MDKYAGTHTKICGPGSLLASALFGLLFAASTEAKTLRLGLITPPSHMWTQAAHNLARDIETKSGGQHTLIVYPSRQLGNEAQMLQLLQTGALDMAILTAAEVSNRIPEFGALYTPYLARNIEQAALVLRGRVAASLLDLLPDEIGVIGLGYGMAGLRQILSTIPVSSLSDIQGRKLRITPFEPIRDFYRLAGAAPTPMPLASVYDALANGQIDMLDMDLELILKLKYHELSDTLVISNHMMFPSVAMLSGKVWIRLAEEDRQMISELTAKHMDWVIDQAVHEEAAWQAGVRNLDNGLKILDVGPEFFGNTAAAWEAIWVPKAGVISALRSEVENGAN